MQDLLVATWEDGVFAGGAKGCDHELAGRSVRGLTADGRDGVLAVVDGHTLQRRSSDGEWTTLATAACALSCCVVSRGNVYVGTEDARVFCLDESKEFVLLTGFESVEGRETWYAGQALIDGQLLGPPLGVRSIAATTDGALLANVHVGGIPRSVDGGATWHPTIAVETDVHEVRAHPSRPNVVAAASALGLCISTDAGATWTVQHEGLHAPHCSAVAFVGNDVLVSASEDPFSAHGRVYRRAIDRNTPLIAIAGGLPDWTEGAVDTHCIASNGALVAFADKGGNVWVSNDGGAVWSSWSHDMPGPSSVHIL